MPIEEASEPRLDPLSLSMDQIEQLDDDALGHALRRFHKEASEARDPIAAFGAFNQHGSTPW